MFVVGRMGRLGGGRWWLDVGKLARSPTRAAAACTTPMTGRASRWCWRWSGHILGRKIFNWRIPIKVTNIDCFSRLEVVPAKGVISCEHEVIEIVSVLGLASTLGNVEGGLFGSLISVLDWMDNAHNEHERSGEMNDLI